MAASTGRGWHSCPLPSHGTSSAPQEIEAQQADAGTEDVQAAALATTDTVLTALGQHLPPAPTTAIRFHKKQGELGSGMDIHCHPAQTVMAGTPSTSNT